MFLSGSRLFSLIVPPRPHNLENIVFWSVSLVFQVCFSHNSTPNWARKLKICVFVDVLFGGFDFSIPLPSPLILTTRNGLAQKFLPCGGKWTKWGLAKRLGALSILPPPSPQSKFLYLFLNALQILKSILFFPFVEIIWIDAFFTFWFYFKQWRNQKFLKVAVEIFSRCGGKTWNFFRSKYIQHQ